MNHKKANNLPGDKLEEISQMIRVNHAGEYGAKRIYEGQLFALKNSKSYGLIKHMADQEKEHLDYFENKIIDDNVRPTALMPIWHIGGFALGAITGFMGEKAAMACTEAVEDVIEKHYKSQIDQLEKSSQEKELRDKITKFRADEIDHKNIGIEQDSHNAKAYKPLYNLVQNITKTAIFLSKKI